MKGTNSSVLTYSVKQCNVFCLIFSMWDVVTVLKEVNWFVKYCTYASQMVIVPNYHVYKGNNVI